jgi:hypothetical protein
MGSSVRGQNIRKQTSAARAARQTSAAAKTPDQIREQADAFPPVGDPGAISFANWTDASAERKRKKRSSEPLALFAEAVSSLKCNRVELLN